MVLDLERKKNKTKKTENVNLSLQYMILIQQFLPIDFYSNPLTRTSTKILAPIAS